MSTLASRQYNFVDDKNAGVPITASRVDAELNNCITKLNEKVIIQASAPSSPIAGMFWLDSTNKFLKQYRNSEWVIMGVVHAGTSAPSTMQFGDMWLDSSASEAVAKFRNKGNTANIQLLDTNSGASLNNYLLPTGSILLWGTASAPTGWLLCDGTAVSRTTYATLFALIGTTFGTGDGSTTFNLPNCKGKVAVGLDAAQTEFDAMGETGGAKTHTLTTSEMPAHTHTHNGIIEAAGALKSGTASGTNSGGVTGSSGSDGAHNNLQPYITFNYIIKT